MNHRLLLLTTMTMIHFAILADSRELMLCLIFAILSCNVWGLKDFSLIVGWKWICTTIIILLNLSPIIY